MISTVLFTLSGLCVAAMFFPSKATKAAVKQDYSYFVGEADPMPTWQRKTAPRARDRARAVRV